MESATINCCSLSVETFFEAHTGGDEITRQYYRNITLHILEKILPLEFFEIKETEEATHAHQQKLFAQLIPFITYSEINCFPGTISFYALSKYCSNSFKFFFEMISRWLIPGRRLNVVLVYASDFRLPDISDKIYTICEVIIHLEHEEEFKEIQRQFPIIGSEIALGIHSAFYAHRILEIKGLSADEKTAAIQGVIAFLAKRFPQAYDTDVFVEMQHVLVICRDDFKAARQARHLSRIIGVQYLFRKSLQESIKSDPEHRHLRLKIFRAMIQTPHGRKKVLGILVSINLLRDQEVFEERHVLRAIQQYIFSAQIVDQSVVMNKLGYENLSTLYMEIEKKDGSHFTHAEIKKLRKELPIDLKAHIEHKMHPIFMPRNEEEIMRNVLVLSHQLRYIRDIPQVCISFDEQAHSHLFFTVILARVLKPDSRPVPELFQKSQTFLEYIHDRTKMVGHIRKKYAKEASVFRLKLSKDKFIRADQSIDLYKARQTVVAELSRIIGEVRDYNGGMISKQHELLTEIRCLLAAEHKEYNEFLLENFFFSLSPVVVRALVDPKAFKTLFLMLLEGIKEYKQEGYYLKQYIEPYNIYLLVITEDPQVKDMLTQVVHELRISPTELATTHTKANGNTCIGYICCAHDPQKKIQLIEALQNTLQSWERRNYE